MESNMKKIILVTVFILCIFAILGCSPQKDALDDNKNTIDISTGVFSTTPRNLDRIHRAYFTLDAENNTFVLSYDMLSSYLPYGSYEVNDGVLTAKTSDGLYIYIFDVVDDNKLIFRQEGSSVLDVIDTNFSEPIVDKTVFEREE